MTSGNSVYCWRILLISSLVFFLVDFGFYLTVPAQTKIFEDIICRQYEAEGDCKVALVQSELAAVNGWKDTFDALPGILLSIPYGVLADRIGRKPCLLLGLLGVILGEIWARIVCFWSQILPLRLVWLAGAFRLLGGGDLVVSSLICVIVADVFGEQDRATALFQLSAAVMISELLAVPLGGALMTWSSPWVPFVLGLVILTAGIPLAAFLLPETLPEPSGRNQSRTVEEEDAEEDSSDVSFSARLRVLFSATRFATHRNILLALAMFLASSLSRQSTSLLLQYSSTRYGWSIPQASLFLTVRGFVTLAVYLVLMPALSGVLTATTGLSAIQKDRRMAQLSGIFSGAGLGMVALAAVPAWYLATQLVTPEQRSTLYAAVAVVQSVGALVAGPLLADLFRAGLTLGRDEMGLPFLFAGLLVGLAVGAVSAVREREILPDEGDDAERQALLGT
ncbi:hypothetical protein CNMCM8980_010606 [Aspergillus fumigatiaffinis]|uniref:Major facilitator superfamily (MFS) profile domain-containing protein n=1 Tax=Aspergillus fumigatiaffinis TaxID=340414 RepID=A0A8H4MA29_9EURO|nr:hypothetical protein CNMCM5878_007914 [Aspergillus fumigatiaffinis]KAF4232003.1 hypothetical protein CNMCM6457_004982 [Aspergillus fumigatiaffinis]KAF4235251.1 hypothetical protein CNMCM6805_008187 [Aspergillus fumigatiaffinis]KAF4250665.1 hypothetical protein CNMCM8980_010606 [Aspergillus fumigatiaffinis]